MLFVDKIIKVVFCANIPRAREKTKTHKTNITNETKTIAKSIFALVIKISL